MVDPTSIDWALSTAKRVSGDTQGIWSDEEWRAELGNQAVLRAGKTYYDPYAAALIFIINPNNVNQRQEGSVSESFTPPYIIVEQLQKQSTALRATWPAADGAGAKVPDLQLDVRGWG